MTSTVAKIENNRYLQTKIGRGMLAFAMIFITYLILFTTGTKNYLFPVAGGIIGTFSALIVIGGNYLQGNTGQSFRLLIWRACCDLAIGVRFILIPAFNIYLCDKTTCTFTADESYCQFPSFVLEFFVIASEAWFFCNGLDLYFTVTNPFSNFESRLRMYHTFAWSLAVFVSVVPFVLDIGTRVYGFWYITNNVDSDLVCWLKIENQDKLGWPMWLFFFAPLSIFYLACVLSLWVAYNRLRKGLTKSFLPRLTLLVTNTTNVFVLSLYWLVFLVIYSIAFFSRNDNSSNRTFWNILNFTIASKGFSSLIVWILTPESKTGNAKEDDKNAALDANKSLREEVLQFATAGIRSSARAGPIVKESQSKVTRRPPSNRQNSQQTIITPLFFLRFMLGEDRELQLIQKMAENRRTSVFRRTSQLNNPSPSFANHADGIRPEDMRLSQRPTIVTIGRTQTQESVEFGSVITTASNSGGTYSQGKKIGSTVDMMDEDFDPEYAHTTNTSAASHTSSPVPSFRIPVSNTFTPSGVSRSDIQDPERETDVDGAAMSEVQRVSDMVDVEEMHEDTTEALSIWDISGRISKFFTDLYASSDIVEFTEFQPYQFRRVRIAAGISDEIYIQEFSTTIKERLTQGGASGAFFFFSKGENFIAKSCTKEEVNTLEKNAKAYADHMVNYPSSFISKILGAYQLTIYGNELYFFVMNNLFYNAEGITMNEKYDIKGSWVSRNAEPPIEGQSATCSYCEQKFIYQKLRRKANTTGSVRSNTVGSNKSRTASSNMSNAIEMGTVTKENSSSNTGSSSKHVFSPMLSDLSASSNSAHSGTIEDSMEMGRDDMASTATDQQRQCPYTVNGQHEPNVILKDNDIKYKIRLNRETTEELFNQIKADAEFLYSIGIMDYSLLVGVHNTEYIVKDESEASPGPQVVRMSSVNGKKDNVDISNVSPFAPHKTLVKTTSREINEEKKNDEISLALAKKLDVYRVVGPDAYFFGIIDFQQEWNLKKKMERFFKVHFRGADPNGLSAIEPKLYKERFLRKVEDILDFESFHRSNFSVNN